MENGISKQSPISDVKPIEDKKKDQFGIGQNEFVFIW
jgi:hypothetical protein